MPRRLRTTSVVLIESIEEYKSDIYDSLLLFGRKRYYIESLNERDYFLENATPYQIKIEDTVLEDGKWISMLSKIANCLFEKFPECIASATSFKCEWTKSAIFTTAPKINHKELECGLYLNCNHTALHSCWLIQDMLDY